MPNEEGELTIQSREAKAILALVQRIQNEVDKNRAAIREVREELIPDMQHELLGAIGKMLKNVEAKFDRLREDLGLDERPSQQIRREQMMLGPIREESPSRPEILETVREEAQVIAKQVYKDEKKESLFAKIAAEEIEKKSHAAEVRQLKVGMYVAVAGAVAGPIITWILAHHG